MILLLSIACAPESTEEILDLRLQEGDWDDPGDPDAVWFGPEVTIEPGDDIMWCVFGTYTGPEQAIHGLTTFQNEFGHHLVPMGTTASEIDFPDGTVIDCTQTGSLDMGSLEPLVIANATWTGERYTDLGMAIPEGMAVKLDADQRFVVQGHYLNTGTEPFLARDVAVFDFMPMEEVVTWAAPLVTNHGDFTLPKGEASTVSFDCAWEQDFNFVYMLGHMHEWGTSISVEEVAGETVSVVYDVPEWEISFRDQSPVTNFAEGSYTLPAGTALRTTCNWFNSADEDLIFPYEMCVSVSLVWPLQSTEICDGGNL